MNVFNKLCVYSKLKILERTTVTRNWPANLTERDRPHFARNLVYQCPQVDLYHFRSVFLLTDSTLFLFGLFPLGISFLYYRGRLTTHSIKGILDIRRTWRRKKLPARDKPFLVIHDAWCQNYYHWMTQALPRLMLAKKHYPDFILLLPSEYRSNFHQQSLHHFGVRDHLVLENANTYFEVHNLIYVAKDIQVGDYNPLMINDLVSFLRQGLMAKSRSDLFFVHRVSNATRRIVNEAETLSMFVKYGFRVVYFENLTFDEQRDMACHASVLAGVHGAGLTNMLFMSKGSVFELTSQLNGEQYYYFTLSNVLNHQYYYQLCESDGTAGSIQQSNIRVDIPMLNQNLSLITMNLK